MTTEKRTTIAFTKEQYRELSELSKVLGEPPSTVIHRAISLLYYIKIDGLKLHNFQLP